MILPHSIWWDFPYGYMNSRLKSDKEGIAFYKFNALMIFQGKIDAIDMGSQNLKNTIPGPNISETLEYYY